MILALPEPSLARHLARTIDGRSLTGIPGAWHVTIQRTPWRPARARKPSWRRMSARSKQQLQAELAHCRGSVHCHNAPHEDTTLWIVASAYEDGGLSVSHVWAINKETAINAHHMAGASKIDVTNIVAFKFGGAQP